MSRACLSLRSRVIGRLLGILLVVAGIPVAANDRVVPAAATRTEQESLCITSEQVQPHIEYLAGPELRGRKGADALRAAEYIARTFEKSRLRPLFGEEFLQPIIGSPRQTSAGAVRNVIGHNVGAWIEGSDPELRDEFVMITAHFDHLGTKGTEYYPGADDNASGVSMMLEAARIVAQMPVKPRRSLVFVGFGLEEQLLWGSRWFAAHPPWEIEQVKLFITADMIGRSLGDLPLPTVFVLGSERAPALRDVLDEVECPAGLEMLRLGTDLIGTRSDYGPFRDRQVPFLFFSTGEHGDYHTPQDTPEKVDCEKVARISTVILRVALQVADADVPPQWTDEIVPDLEEARTVHRITGLVLEADARGEYSLNGLQRMFVDQVHTKTGNALRLGRLTAAERLWLTRAAQLLLLSVF